jgi:hypothetical protein
MSEFPWTAALACGACLAAGAWMSLAFRGGAAAAPAPDAGSPSSATSAPVVSAADRAALEELTREIRALRAALEEERRAVEPAGVEGPAAGLETLRDEVRELSKLLQQRAASGAGDVRRELDLRSPGPRRAELFVRSEDVDTDEALERAHLLWTYERVLEAYGPPDWVRLNNGAMSWTYVEPDTKRETRLEFCDGYVANAFECDD